MATERKRIKNLEDLKEGDMVEFRRFGYSHWGIYVGKNKVIHVKGRSKDLSGPFSICGVEYRKAEMVEEDIFEVAQGSKFYRNNRLDDKLTPGTPEEIVDYARDRLGEVEYNIWSDNCEHKTTSCRYTIERSGQVEKFMLILKITATAIGVAGAARYSYRQHHKQASNAGH